jgi:hypothetical protein
MAKATVTATPGYVAQLEGALRRHLRGAKVQHEQVRRDRYRFIVLWGGFDNLGHPERQRKVWDVADATLNKGDLLNVAMILTLGTND